jgi:hypothetical protein
MPLKCPQRDRVLWPNSDQATALLVMVRRNVAASTAAKSQIAVDAPYGCEYSLPSINSVFLSLYFQSIRAPVAQALSFLITCSVPSRIRPEFSTVVFGFIITCAALPRSTRQIRPDSIGKALHIVSCSVIAFSTLGSPRTLHITFFEAHVGIDSSCFHHLHSTGNERSSKQAILGIQLSSALSITPRSAVENPSHDARRLPYAILLSGSIWRDWISRELDSQTQLLGPAEIPQFLGKHSIGAV